MDKIIDLYNKLSDKVELLENIDNYLCQELNGLLLKLKFELEVEVNRQFLLQEEIKNFENQLLMIKI